MVMYLRPWAKTGDKGSGFARHHLYEFGQVFSYFMF